MKKKMARCLALGLLLVCLLALASPGLALRGEYAFPPAGSEDIHSSSGTGGSQRREDETTPAFTVENQDGTPHENDWWPSWEMEEPALLRIPGNPDLEEQINAWRVEARASLIAASLDMTDPDNIPTYDYDFPVLENFYDRGPLLSIVMSLDGLYRTAVFDLADGRQLALSDLFSDGFNYIDHINRYLVTSTLQEGRNGLLDQDFWSYSTLETHQIGPFTGLANDYPFFTLTRNSLQLYLPYYNPFFQLYAPGMLDLEFLIPLSHAISPFAGCLVARDYTTYETAGGWRLPLLALTIDHGAYPEAQAAINAHIAQGLAEATAPGAYPEHWRNFEVQDYLQHYGEYVSVLYPVLDWLDSPAPDCRILWGGLYHLHTGEALDFAPLVTQLAARPDANFSREILVGDQETFEACEDTPDLDDAELLGAFLASWQHELTLRLQQPSGHEVRLVLPAEALDEVLPLALSVAPPDND